MRGGAHKAGRSMSLALPALLLGATLTGLAPILVRLAVAEGVTPTAAAFWRLALSLPLLAIWAAGEARAQGQSADASNSNSNRDGDGGRDGARRGDRRALGFALLAGLFFAGDLTTWHAGIVRTDVANATLLVNLTPILVGVAAWLLLGERPARRFVLGGAVALSGAALLTGAGFGGVDAAAHGTRALGDALCALTAVWYAAYLLAVKVARGRMGAGRVMFLSTLVGAGALLAVMLLTGLVSFWPQTAAAWTFLFMLGALTQAGGQGAIAYALGRLPAGFAALMILAQPLAASIIAAFVFDEVPGPLQLLGGAVVVAGLWVAVRARAGVANPPA